MPRILQVVIVPLPGPALFHETLRKIRCLPSGKDAPDYLVIAEPEDAAVKALPRDASQLQSLKACVAGMEQAHSCRFLFLALDRIWNDQRRCYSAGGLGERAAASLLTCGETELPLLLSSFSSASLAGQYDAALFSDLSLSFLPGTPAEMLREAEKFPELPVCARVIVRPRFPELLIDKLMEMGFSLSPLKARSDLLRLEDASERAALYPFSALCVAAAAPEKGIPCRALTEARFVSDRFANLRDELSALSRDCERAWTEKHAASRFEPASLRRQRRMDRLRAALPVAQFAAVFLAASRGIPALLFLSIVVPELSGGLSLALLPCALVRLSLLPARACISANAMLRCRFARAKLLRPFLPAYWEHPDSAAFWAIALLLLAARSHRAAVTLFGISLLWLCAPLIARALASPIRERIPLDERERSLLSAKAADAFHRLNPAASSPGAAMLCACAGCALGILEMDEAGRQMERLNKDAVYFGAFDQACALAAAAFLRERLSLCDAALRQLPEQIEENVRRSPVDLGNSPLAGLLRCARGGRACAIYEFPASAEDALFLPLPMLRLQSDALLMPLTHPHTFLRIPESAPEEGSADLRFLILAAALLEEGFGPMLLHSPVISPAAPLAMTRALGGQNSKTAASPSLSESDAAAAKA